jgi:hypothetical protein
MRLAHFSNVGLCCFCRFSKIYPIKGVATGCFAGVVDISTKWLSDIKMGICNGSIFMNREQCCWSAYDYENCTEWLLWSDVFHAKSDGAKYVANYFLYVILAGNLFDIAIKYYFCEKCYLFFG